MLAKTAAHPTSPQADPPLSRASSLPQWIAGALSIRIQHQTLWERACSRRRRHIQPHHKQTHRHREQAQLPQGFVANAGPLITPAPLWERACSRRRRHIQHQCKQTHRYREQAQLPQEIAAAHSIRTQHQTLQQLLKHWHESARSRCPRWPSCVARCLRWCGSNLPGHRAFRAGR